MSCVQNPAKAELLWKLHEERAEKATFQAQVGSETTHGSASLNGSDIDVASKSPVDFTKSCHCSIPTSKTKGPRCSHTKACVLKTNNAHFPQETCHQETNTPPPHLTPFQPSNLFLGRLFTRAQQRKLIPLPSLKIPHFLKQLSFLRHTAIRPTCHPRRHCGRPLKHTANMPPDSLHQRSKSFS